MRRQVPKLHRSRKYWPALSLMHRWIARDHLQATGKVADRHNERSVIGQGVLGVQGRRYFGRVSAARRRPVRSLFSMSMAQPALNAAAQVEAPSRSLEIGYEAEPRRLQSFGQRSSTMDFPFACRQSLPRGVDDQDQEWLFEGNFL